MSLTKKQMDNYATALGLIGGLSHLLSELNVIPKPVAGVISGISMVFLGYLVQKPSINAKKEVASTHLEDLD